ncbi:hypothetical protein [Streptomyces atriruber]|nr:hypothetical protein [Streptomyces atriruber]
MRSAGPKLRWSLAVDKAEASALKELAEGGGRQEVECTSAL